jgi:hypothetical protein
MSELGIIKLAYMQDFYDLVREIDPYIIQQQAFSKRIHLDSIAFNGEAIPCYDYNKEEEEYIPTKEECAIFKKTCDEYIARRCFEELGWDVFEKLCIQDGLDDLLIKARPCMSADGQCSMFCRYYGGKCRYEANCTECNA